MMPPKPLTPTGAPGRQPPMPGSPLASAPPAAWSLSGVDVARESGTDLARGLSQSEGAARLAGVGPNEVARRHGPSLLRRVVGQLTDTMILVLLAAAVLTAVVGDFPDTVVILAVIAVNTTIGVSQEIRASRAIDALSTMTAPSARVVRDGTERTVAAREVVPGDLLRTAAGDVVSADARLVRTEHGVSSGLLTSPLEVPVLRDLLVDGGARRGHPQVLLRFGYGPEPTPTPRRSVSDVLTHSGWRTWDIS